MIEAEIEHMEKDMEQRLQQSGIDLEQYLVLTRTSEEDLKKQLQVEAQKGLESWLVLDGVGQKENINITDEEIEFELSKMADQYKMTIDQIKEALGQQMSQFKSNLIMSRVEDYLFQNNQ